MALSGFEIAMGGITSIPITGGLIFLGYKGFGERNLDTSKLKPKKSVQVKKSTESKNPTDSKKPNENKKRSETNNKSKETQNSVKTTKVDASIKSIEN